MAPDRDIQGSDTVVDVSREAIGDHDQRRPAAGLLAARPAAVSPVRGAPSVHGRHGEDITSLASPAASCVTGTTFSIEGGRKAQ